MRARFRDRRDDARTVFRLALFQLDPQGGIAARGHRNLFDHLFRPSIARAAKKGCAHEPLFDFDSGRQLNLASPAAYWFSAPSGAI